ncbi:hypothetical protein B0O80DRAFT_432035 [Mortierella sp. GBAus27b]|nr:hypothetical protein B0O80DRAFT_432035 [Mortierella sp. GBAus27b]
MPLIRTSLSSLSAAVALTSNAFLISLLIFPDPVPAKDRTLRSMHEYYAQQTIQLLNDPRPHVPRDPRLSSIPGPTWSKKDIPNSAFQHSLDSTLMVAENWLHIKDTSRLSTTDFMKETPMDDESYRLRDPAEDILDTSLQCESIPRNPTSHDDKDMTRTSTLHGTGTSSCRTIDTAIDRFDMPYTQSHPITRSRDRPDQESINTNMNSWRTSGPLWSTSPPNSTSNMMWGLTPKEAMNVVDREALPWTELIDNAPSDALD